MIVADLIAILWLKACFLLIVLFLPSPHQLRWGLCTDQKTDFAVKETWISTGYDWEPTLCFDPLRMEWREVELGFMDYEKDYGRCLYYVRLQSGDRSEWVEVSDEEYNAAVIGEMFWR